MAGPEDAIRSVVPGGIGKPMLLALLALLASGSLFRRGAADPQPAPTQPSPPPTQPTPTPPTADHGQGGGLLGGLGGLLDKLQKGGLGEATNSWVGSGQNTPVSPGQVGSALGPDIIKELAQRSGLSEEDVIKGLSQVLPGVVDKLTPKGRIPTAAEFSEFK